MCIVIWMIEQKLTQLIYRIYKEGTFSFESRFCVRWKSRDRVSVTARRRLVSLVCPQTHRNVCEYRVINRDFWGCTLTSGVMDLTVRLTSQVCEWKLNEEWSWTRPRRNFSVVLNFILTSESHHAKVSCPNNFGRTVVLSSCLILCF